MGLIWPNDDSSNNITIPLVNDDGSDFAWPANLSAATARLTKQTSPALATVVVPVTPVTGQAIINGAVLAALALPGGEYAVEVLATSADGLQRRMPTEGGLRLTVREPETP